MAEHSRLFKPLKIGNMNLSNRIVMAPLTRFRSDAQHVPLPMVGEYYTQRGSYPGTLLITEAVFISHQASGFPNVPGIFTDDQIAAWKKIVSDVHKDGSYIYLQLWALGRAANTDTLAEKGLDVISSSDIPITDDAARGGGAKPRALTEAEIQQFIKDYAMAAKNAVQGAGFDGVEIHGANGYLIDQFTQDVCNNRSDQWGGSIENRARFCIEVTKAVVNAVGADKTGIRLSPWSTFQSMRMTDPIPQFSYILQQLKTLKLAYVHTVESRIAGNADVESFDKNDWVSDIWDVSPVLVAGGFKPDSAQRLVDEEWPQREIAVVFGRYFISNPDLVYRVKNGIELVKYDRDTFYTPHKAEGYTDYPFSAEWEKEVKESKL